MRNVAIWLLVALGPLGCGDKGGDDTAGPGGGSGSEADVDGDGYTPSQVDCDDFVANVNPGAPEICDDVDNDCDGLIDMEDPDIADAKTWSVDQDGDGFGSDSLSANGCDQPAGTVSNADDCDDSDEDVNPDAYEQCDGFDNDCDGLTDADDPGVIDGSQYYPDGDGDGFGEEGSALVTLCEVTEGYVEIAGDCDDGLADIYPGAPEVCGDGIDSDCDGEEGVPSIGQGQDLDCAQATLVGSAASTGAFAGIAGDLTGSGVGSLVFTSEADKVYVVDDAKGRVDIEPDAAATVVEASSGRSLGAAVAWGDLTGDGQEDLVVGAPFDDSGQTDAGASFLMAGPLSGSISVGSADAVLLGTNFGEHAGAALLVVADQTGDGVPDLLVGAPTYNSVINRGGAVYLLAGPLTGSISLDDAEGLFTGERKAYQLGYNLTSIGDTDGDGYDDAASGAPSDDDEASDAGAFFALLGPVQSGSWNATARVSGETAGDGLGSAIFGPGDVNGDGYADVLVGAPGNDTNGSSAGAVYLVDGPVDADDVLSDYASLTLLGPDDADLAGTSISAADLNGDGEIDFVVGAPRDTFNPGPGQAFVVFGPQAGEVELSLADLTIEGTADGDRLGQSVATGDHDADGNADLLMAAPLGDTGGTDFGEAFLLMGGP